MKKLINFAPYYLIDRFSISISIVGTLFILIAGIAYLFGTTTDPLLENFIRSGPTMGVVGSLLLFGMLVRWRHIPISIFIVPFLYLFGIKWRWNNKRYFKEQTCQDSLGKVLGELRYENDEGGRTQLILDLKTSDPYEMGFAHGFLLAPDIQELSQRFLRPMIFLCRILTGDFSGRVFYSKAKGIIIPPSYQTELEGLFEGVQAYRNKTGNKVKINKEDLVRVHTFSNVYKAIGCQSILGIKKFHLSLGCTTAVIKTNESIIVGRTLDWLSMGMMGSFSLIRRHSTPTGKRIESHTLPAFIGALTARSSTGLITIINELGTASKAGIPYHLLARLAIESCDTVSQVKAFIDSLPSSSRPASSHHLIAIDRTTALNFQFYTKEGEYYLPRYLGPSGFLVVTNHAVDDETGEILVETICDLTSKKRFNDMTQVLKIQREKTQADRQAMILGLYAVSNATTTGSALFCLNNSEWQVQYASDNFFAADHLI